MKQKSSRGERRQAGEAGERAGKKESRQGREQAWCAGRGESRHGESRNSPAPQPNIVPRVFVFGAKKDDSGPKVDERDGCRDCYAQEMSSLGKVPKKTKKRGAIQRRREVLGIEPILACTSSSTSSPPQNMLIYLFSN
jgi:hypothetical protein